MTPPKLARAVKAWGIVGPRGNLMPYTYRLKFACARAPGERIARVLITEIPPRAKR